MNNIFCFLCCKFKILHLSGMKVSILLLSIGRLSSYNFLFLLIIFFLMWKVLKEVLSSSSAKKFDEEFLSIRESILQVRSTKFKFSALVSFIHNIIVADCP